MYLVLARLSRANGEGKKGPDRGPPQQGWLLVLRVPVLDLAAAAFQVCILVGRIGHGKQQKGGRGKGGPPQQ